MQPLDAVKSVYTNYVNFQGRARRSEYWWFYLFYLVVGIILVSTEASMSGTMVLYTIFVLATFIPALAVTVRRLHDTSRSGWWILIAFVPIIGGIWLLVLLVLDSHAENKYGPNPKLNVAVTLA